MNKDVLLTSMNFFFKNGKNSKNYKDYLVDNIKIKNEGFIFQGITKVEEMYLVTAYKPGSNSIIFIYDNDFDLIRRTHLYNNAHVGGICYDGDSTIYITDKHGSISIYDLNEILNNDLVYPKNKQIDVSNKLKNIFGQTACAYIQHHRDLLFLGNFNKKNSSVLKIYKESKLNKEFKIIENFESLVQGVAVNDKYILVSSSFGILNKSIVSIYEYDKDFNLKLVDKIKLPPMIEQIHLDGTKLICLFEINCYTKKDKYDDILILDLLEFLH